MMSYLEELIRKEKNAKEDEEGEITLSNLDDRVNVIYCSYPESLFHRVARAKYTFAMATFTNCRGC